MVWLVAANLRASQTQYPALCPVHRPAERSSPTQSQKLPGETFGAKLLADEALPAAGTGTCGLSAGAVKMRLVA